jgi:hypothetical protein
MADGAKAGPGAGRGKTWLWMILALVVVGGFLAWLGMASEPTAVPVVEEEDDQPGEVMDGDVQLVDRETLADDKSAYEGQRVRVQGVEASSELGPRIFWGELGDQANQVPILVRLDSTAAEGWQMRQGSSYDLTGTIQRMSDSIAAEWGEQGEFRGEGEEMQATFTDYFIQTSRIRPARGDGSGSGAGSAGGDAGATEGGEGGEGDAAASGDDG